MAFAEWSQNNEDSFNNVWFSDQAHFHLDGVVHKQNVRIWESENACVIHEKVHHAPRITMWVAISSHGLLWPIFFEETVAMLRNTSVPHLLATGLPLQAQWFMQEGVRLHIVNTVLDFLHDTLDLHVISNRFPDHFTCRQNWPTNSPDLSPRDYFIRGLLKEKIFLKKPQTITELRVLTIQAFNEITENTCCQVLNNITFVLKKLPDLMVVILNT
jgi:hypothetical protein